jgi:hypothetical protein
MIETPEQLEAALGEYQRLRDAPDGSASARRRAELDAEIKAYYALGDRYSLREAGATVSKPLHKAPGEE